MRSFRKMSPFLFSTVTLSLTVNQLQVVNRAEHAQVLFGVKLPIRRDSGQAQLCLCT